MRTGVFSFAVFFIVLSCTPKKESRADNRDPDSGYVVAGDSLIIPSFEIEVKLSDKAESKLSQAKETIIVQAYLSGTPKDPNGPRVDEMGEINLGGPRVELSKPGVAAFREAKISKKDFELLGDRNFQVLINIFSGRRSSEYNLLTCDILQEPISKVKDKKHVLKGKLIEE